MSGHVGQVIKWQSSVDNGLNWADITHTLTTLPHSSITINTLYRSIVINESNCPTDTSIIASFSISPYSNSGILTKNDTVCNGINYDTLKTNVITGNIIDWISKTNPTANWSNLGNTNSSLTYSNITQSTYYAVIVKSGVCNADTSNIVGIIVKNANPANAGPDKTITLHENTTLDASGDGNVVWSPSSSLDNSTVLNPTAAPTNTTTYTMILTDRFGCISIDSVKINVYIPIPNAITPNGDGYNDYLEINEITRYPQNILTIYNRWGIEVYTASPYNNQWDGKNKNGENLPDEIYFYSFDYGNGEKSVNGNILIKR
jgi:gliding motility-associated-like protein